VFSMFRVIAFILCLLGNAGAACANERLALVVGNSAYLSSPLVNPRNDANAMATLLTKAGFKVDQQLDTNLTQLQAAVDRFGVAIRDPKVKFGLFYYAGHGLQQDWRNYLVPVSAKIKTATDVSKQTVDVSDLLRYMEQSQGRSFLIILDACRDDPFAGAFKPASKGLSQFDAPAGSLLAFATSPGNVALDGDGQNGLYTGFLLREFAAPGVRLEDAFKRVRLSVRLASNGAQVPWESTSLEETLYLFPTYAPNLTEAEKDQLLEKEMNTWLRVKSSTDPQVLANFIREYPSGSASELAQSRMNRMLAAMAAQETQRLSVLAQNAALADQEAKTKALAEQAEAARKKAADAEEKRLAAQRVEAERVRVAQADAAREEALRQQAARDAAALAESARLAKEKALAAEQDAKRLAVAQAEAARLSQFQAQVAAAEIKRLQALQQQKADQERELAQQAERARIEQARLAELQQREAERLASEQQTRQAQENQRLQVAKAEQDRLTAERAEKERVRLAQIEAEKEEAQRLHLAKEASDRSQATRVAQKLAQSLEREAIRLAAIQAEAARQSLMQAQAAELELNRLQAQQAEKAKAERELAQQAEETRLQLARQAEIQKQEAAQLAAQKSATLAVATSNVVLATLQPTPYFKGYAEHQRSYSVGDVFNIRVINQYNKSTKPLVMKVTQVDPSAERVIYNDGEFVSDLMGNITTNTVGAMSTPRQFYPADLMVGKKWHTRFKQTRPNGTVYTFQYDLKVVAKESITVPAGTFEAFKIEARGLNIELGAYLERNIWVTPGVNADIAHEIVVRLRNGFTEQYDRQELVSYTQAVHTKSTP
jgi:uncharacterized caspase-like protein